MDDNPRPLKRGPGGEWVSSDGTPLERLFQEDYLMWIMAVRATPEFGMSDLARLEKSGPTMRQWVQQFRMWEVLFQRDYPEQFQESLELAHPSHMNERTRQNLDEYSEQPQRNETYWKRLYELNVRAAQKATQYDTDVPRDTLASPVARIDIAALPNTLGKLMVALPANRREKDEQGNQVALYIWRTPNMDFVPPAMIRVAVWPLEGFVSQAVDFTPALLGKLIDPSRGFGCATVPMLAYGALRYLTFNGEHFGAFFSSPQRKRFALVSSCILSSCTKEATHKCANCNAASYCSVGCQASDWERHRKECQ